MITMRNNQIALMAVMLFGIASACAPTGMLFNMTFPENGSTSEYGSTPPFVFTVSNLTTGFANCTLQGKQFTWNDYAGPTTVTDGVENSWTWFDDPAVGAWTWRLNCTENESDVCATTFSPEFVFNVTEPTYCCTCPEVTTYISTDIQASWLPADLQPNTIIGALLALIGAYGIYWYAMRFMYGWGR